VCWQELSSQQVICSSDSRPDIVNVSVENPDTTEQFLHIVLDGVLPSFAPSPECNAAFRLLSCLVEFGACDANSTQLATMEMCIDVRDRLCVKEWSSIAEFVGPRGLPDCELLPQSIGQQCAGMSQCACFRGEGVPCIQSLPGEASSALTVVGSDHMINHELHAWNPQHCKATKGRA